MRIESVGNASYSQIKVLYLGTSPAVRTIFKRFLPPLVFRVGTLGGDMAKSFNHKVYLSEKEISDQIQENFDIHFNEMGDSKLYREVYLGRAKADFLEFNPHFVNVIEVKIAADIDTVRQVVFYKRIIEEHLRLNFTERNLKLNNICMSIFARSFDKDMIDLCEELQIALFKLSFDNNKKLLKSEYLNEFFPRIEESKELLDIMISEMGIKNV